MIKIPAKYKDLEPDLSTEQGRARIRLMCKMIVAESGANPLTTACLSAIADADAARASEKEAALAAEAAGLRRRMRWVEED